MANSSSSSSSSVGIGILGAMFLIMFCLKLAGIGACATWSWWAITAPLWGGLALVLVILLIAGIIYGVAATRAKNKHNTQLNKIRSGRF